MASSPEAFEVGGLATSSSGSALNQRARGVPDREAFSARSSGSSLDIDGRSSTGRRSPSVLSSVVSGKLNSSRRTSVSGNPTQGTTGSFLTRFISSFRSPLTSSSRPNLARSLSSPGGRLPVRETGLPMTVSSSLSTKSSKRGSPMSKFRPNFRRRATTGSPSSSPTPSPSSSPPLARDRVTEAATGSVYTRERDPMDGALKSPSGNTSDLRLAESDAARTSSRQSQSRGRPSPSTLPPASPLSRHTFDASTPRVTDGGQARRIQDPLSIITTLLPPGLLLLSQIGPQHLYSPPSLLPPDITIPLPSPASSTAPYISSDRASVASSQTSSSSYPSLPTVVLPTHSYSHELHAPSTISLPAVSAAAVWRLFRGFEWVTDVALGNGRPLSQASSEEDDVTKVFDFPSLLQGVADILAADAAVRGVELVLGISGRGSDSKPEAPLDDGLVHDPNSSEESPTKMASRQLLVRAEERAWGIILAWALSHILSNAPTGSSIECFYAASPTSSPSHLDFETSFGSQETAVPTRRSLQQWWLVSLQIRVKLPRHFTSDLPLPEPPFSTDFAQSLFGYLNIKATPTRVEDQFTSWSLQVVLPEAKPVVKDPRESSSLLGRRRATLAATGQEPSLEELIAFVASGLKGVKIALHAGTHSTFARHVSAFLAEWGMDVAHTPLDSEGIPVESPSERPRFDSGFGNGISENSLPASPFPSETTLPFKSGDFPSPSGSSSATGSGDSASPSNLIVIDDDISILRRFLFLHRSANPGPPLAGKRPPLTSRRTRSSPHVRQLHQGTPNSSLVIIYFASLNRYKAIKELVQDALATSRSPHLPEVLVIPKPAGPRRILTALWTAYKRPAVDPSLPPIATAPSSPGSQYWSQKLSPALSNQQDFDSAAAEALAGKGDYSGKPRTPPTYYPHGPVGHPPSPLGKISDDQVSYFSCVADGMAGTSPSEGMVIQNPDGRPALFFQPSSRGSRGTSARTQRSISADKPGSAQVSPALDLGGSAVAPREIGLGSGRATSSVPSSASGGDSPAAVSNPALPLASLITAAKTRAVPDDEASLSTPDDDSSAAEGPPPLSRQPSLARLQSRQSVRPSLPRTFTHPSAPRRTSETNVAGTPLQNSNPAKSKDTPTAPVLQGRRSSGSTTHGRSRRNTTRKATLPTVPPINVLIVEDNPINQMILAMFMKKKGIKYAVAKDGEEAVQKWKDGNFHLVLMDIQLPVKDGIEATRDIRELERAANAERLMLSPNSDSAISPTLSTKSNPISNPSTPLPSMPVIIVALTASSLQIDRVTALAAGCNDFLTKPVSLPWLQQKLLEWGSMAYLSGFSRQGSQESLESAGGSGLNSRTASISAHLHIEPKPSKMLSSRPSLSRRTPSFRASGLTAVAIAENATPSPEEPKATDLSLDDVDSRLAKLVTVPSVRRPGLSPLTSPVEPSLETVVAEGTRLVNIGRSRSGSLADSFSQVINSGAATSSNGA